VVVQAAKNGVTSASITVNPTAGNQGTINLGDIVLSPPVAIVTLTWGEAPSDLDSHLLIPVNGGYGPGHVWYSNKGSRTSYPFADLDTDDVTSYGPEVVTILRKFAGTYNYLIHNFSGEAYGPLTNSSAKISLIVGGSLYNFNVPGSNPNSYPVWHVFDLVVDDNGNVSINTINTFEEYATTIGGGSMGKLPAKK
jgi:hypothetical protein